MLLASMMNYRSPEVVRTVTEYGKDMLVLERNVVTPESHEFIRYFQGLGIPICLDWDDAYQILPVANPAFPFWHLNKGNLDPPPLEMLRRALKMADGFTSPSKRILEDWQEAADGRTFWLPNYAPRGWYESLPGPENNGRVVIGWGGSVSHYDSWHGSGLYEAAKRVAEKRPEVLFRIHGNDPRIWAHLPVPQQNKEMVSGVPPEQWPQLLSKFDIGVAPLHGEYDQRRSWIKGLEYSLAAVPWLATAGSPYADLWEALDANEATKGAGVAVGAHNPVTPGEVADNVDAWEAAILAAIDDLPARKAKAKAARAVALERWTSEANVESTVALYRRIAAGARNAAILPGIMYINWPIQAGTALSL